MFGLNPDKWLLLAFFIIPGFVAHRVYTLKCPSQKGDLEKLVPEFIAYSALNMVFWWWWVHHLLSTPFEQIPPWELTLSLLVVCVASPALLALIWYRLRVKVLHHRFGIDHPTPRAWDYFIQTHGHFFVLFHLKNGKMLGGYFASNSYAAVFPQEPEIYVEQVWRVDEIGRFVEEVSGSAGAIVPQADWELVEFFTIQREPSNEPESETATRKQRSDLDSGGSGRKGDCGEGSAGTTANPDGTGEDNSSAGWLRNGITPEQSTQEIRNTDVCE